MAMTTEQYKEMNSNIEEAVQAFGLAKTFLEEAWKVCPDPEWKKMIASAHLKMKSAGQDVGFNV